MNSFIIKFGIVAVIFIAEAASILSEILAAKYYADPGASFWKIFIRLSLYTLFFASFIIAGYMFGLRYFKNIWIVSVISITSILIAEPIIAFTVFRQTPTKGALLGLIFGFLGFASTLLLK